MRARALAATLVGAATICGCSALNAARSTRSESQAQAGDIARAQRTHEYPAPPPHETVARGFGTPVDAIESFATAYINWTAKTVSDRLRGLAALSIGQARSVTSLAAAQTAQDYELRRAGISNSGTVEAIAPVLGTAHQYAVVTWERTTASNTTAYQGLHPAWHVALATVTRITQGGWVISSWQPED